MKIKNFLYAIAISSATLGCEVNVPDYLPAGVEETVKDAEPPKETEEILFVSGEYLEPLVDNYKNLIVSGKKAVYVIKTSDKENCELYLLVEETRTYQKIIIIDDLNCDNIADAVYTGPYDYFSEDLIKNNKDILFNNWLKEAREKAFPTRNIPQELEDIVDKINN